MKSAGSSRNIWLPVLLAAAALLYRVVKLKFGMASNLPNFSPWMALAFAGTLLAPRAVAWWVWPALLMGCDVLISTGEMAEMWLVYACYGIAALAGGWLRKNSSLLLAFGGTAASSLVFYVVTNTQAWFMSPEYARSLSGWIQALTVGNPAWPQTWIFGLSSLASDLAFTLLLVIAYNGEALARRVAMLPVMHERLAAS